MIHLFNIWHPYLLTSTRLVLDITPAEAALVRNGTTSFVSSCLGTFGVAANPSLWTIRTARQSYYSDYLHSHDWRARWDIVWILEVILSSPVNLSDPVPAVPYKTSASDESAEGYDEPTMDLCQTLLLASFSVRENIERDISETMLNWKAGRGLTSEIPLRCLPHAEGRVLVRGLIDSLKFPDAIDDLELLNAQWKRIGGLTNWHDLATLI